MNSKDRTVTLGDLISRRRRGLSPFPTEDEWKELEEVEAESLNAKPQQLKEAHLNKSEVGENMDGIKTLTDKMRQINNDLRSKRESGSTSLSDCLSAVGRAFDAYTELPSEETQLLHQAAQQKYGGLARAIFPASKTDEVLAIGQVVVTYRPTFPNRGAQQKDKIRNAITAILTANPSADLIAIQDSIGVTIINVQRPAPPTPKPHKGFNG
jgi:hypothetical protein